MSNQPNDSKMNARDDETEIDLSEVLFVLGHKILYLLLGTAVGLVLAFGITKFLITPQYTASSMIYIFTKTTSITSLTDLQIGSQLTVDFKTLGTSRPVVERVIRDLSLDTTYENLLTTITISNPTNSRILQISVDNPDPKLAADISNAMASSLSDRVAEVLNTDKPATVEDAVVPSKPSSPKTMRNVAIGGLIGLIIAMFIVLVQHFMDDTIKTDEDVRKYLEINTLAVIPLDHSAEQGRGGRFGGHHGHSGGGHHGSPYNAYTPIAKQSSGAAAVRPSAPPAEDPVRDLISKTVEQTRTKAPEAQKPARGVTFGKKERYGRVKHDE